MDYSKLKRGFRSFLKLTNRYLVSTLFILWSVTLAVKYYRVSTWHFVFAAVGGACFTFLLLSKIRYYRSRFMAGNP